MSQQRQVMLQGNPRRGRILIGILLIAFCAALLEAWRPGTLHSIASGILHAFFLLLGYVRSLISFLRDLAQT